MQHRWYLWCHTSHRHAHCLRSWGGLSSTWHGRLLERALGIRCGGRKHGVIVVVTCAFFVDRVLFVLFEFERPPVDVVEWHLVRQRQHWKVLKAFEWFWVVFRKVLSYLMGLSELNDIPYTNPYYLIITYERSHHNSLEVFKTFSTLVSATTVDWRSQAGVFITSRSIICR